MESVCEYLKKCGVYYLATMEGDQPRVRPFGVAEILDGKLYFLTGKRKDVSKQMLQNPKIEICAASGSEWIVLRLVHLGSLAALADPANTPGCLN